MTQKSKFLKSAKLAIAGVVLTSGLAACSMVSEKHNCSSKASQTKEEKANCSSAMKKEKANCSANKKADQ